MAITMLVILFVVAACASDNGGDPSKIQPTTTFPSEGSEQQHSSGLVLVASDSATPGVLSEKILAVLNDALILVDDNPNEFGYPWFDRQSGQLVLDFVTNSGRDLASNFASQHTVSGVSVILRSVSRTYAELERIKDDSTHLNEAVVPDFELIYMTEPDAQHNRIIITIDRLSDKLLNGLAARYGTDAIAIRHQPRQAINPQ